MRCLVCCCWRQINGTYVKQLEGFLQFGGSLTYWKTMATYNVRAPPTGCKQNITGQVLKIYHQQKPSQYCHQDLKIHLQQTFWWVRLNWMHESIYCIGKHINIELLCESSHYDTDFQAHANSLMWCISLTSQQVRQEGPTLLRNSVIPLSNVFK